MFFLEIELPDWQKFLFGDQDHWFLIEILLRTVVMYLALLFGLRLMGKRGVRQLSVFELVVIIGLGSAAGDPMFYEEVGILSALAVFITVIAVYRLTTFLIAKSKRVEGIVEGKTVCLIEDGRFCIKSFDKEDLAQDEFFSELRVKGISHIGQVDRAYLEVSGELSVFYFADEDVKPGLPILMHEFGDQAKEITVAGTYACSNCGNPEKIPVIAVHKCSNCGKDKWVKAVDRKRVT